MEVRPIARLSRHRLCACGCGEPITGRRSRRFYSDACRKRHNRGSASRQNVPLAGPAGRESRTRAKPPPGIPDVRVADTELSEVHCPCGRLTPGIYGPLQVSAYCADCVEAERCPCGSRPAWHGRPAHPVDIRPAQAHNRGGGP